MIKKFVFWYLKRMLTHSSHVVSRRNVEVKLIDMMLEVSEYTYHEDTVPTHPYLITYYLSRAIRNRYVKWWDNDFLKIINRGMNNEIERAFTHKDYDFTN